MRGLHALKFSPAYVAISQLRSLITARWLVTQEPRRECDPPPADGHTRSEQSTNECKYNIPRGMWMKPLRNISSPQPRSDILFRGLGTTFAMWRRAPTSPLKSMRFQARQRLRHSRSAAGDRSRVVSVPDPTRVAQHRHTPFKMSFLHFCILGAHSRITARSAFADANCNETSVALSGADRSGYVS